LETNQTAAELIKMALERPRCRYSVNFSRGIYSTFPHLDGLRNLAQLPDYAAMLAAEGGDGHAAAEHIAQIAALARTLENEPILVSQLVRLSVLRIGVRRFERALSLTKFSDEDLRRLENVFAAASGTNCMTRALIGERAWVISALRARDFGGLLSNPGAPTPKRPGASELILFPLMRISGFLERDLRFYLEYMDKIVTQSQPGPPRSLGISDITEAYATEARRKYYVFTGLTVPALARISRREAEGLAFLRLAETACAIERFAIAKGSFPGALSDLAPNFRVQVAADPFDGQLLRYKRLDDGYVLYSIGPDVHDDGGIEPKTDTNRRGPEDLVFKVVKK
jgi:hypothetical protein